MHHVRDLMLLIGRVAVGVVFVLHGWQKLVTFGMDATAGSFEKMGIPLPTVAAWFTALVELLGGAGFIVGLLLPLAGLGLAVVTVGALAFVHLKNGFWMQNGGYEYVLVLAGASLSLGFAGGRFSLDHLLLRTWSQRRELHASAQAD